MAYANRCTDVSPTFAGKAVLVFPNGYEIEIAALTAERPMIEWIAGDSIVKREPDYSKPMRIRVVLP